MAYYIEATKQFTDHIIVQITQCGRHQCSIVPRSTPTRGHPTDLYSYTKHGVNSVAAEGGG